jgi:hypothetical protein
VKYATDNEGNHYLLLGASGTVYEIHAFPASKDVPKMGASISSEGDLATTALVGWSATKAYASHIGGRYAAVGNGTADPLIMNMSATPPVALATASLSTDMYAMENTAFPKCTMFVRGPNKTIYASGNPSELLTVYVSEPSGLTDDLKMGLYASGSMSKVDLLLTDATKITALSVLGPYVVVHTDAGVTLLYAPDADQADTGFRVKQVASPVSSAAVNQRVVGGQQSQPFFLGRDGQIYKDESTTAGPDGKPLYSDPRQVSWKAKGLWSDASAQDISKSFAAYDPGIGMYFLHLPTTEAES